MEGEITSRVADKEEIIRKSAGRGVATINSVSKADSRVVQWIPPQ
jgi:hypothetical protein